MKKNIIKIAKEVVKIETTSLKKLEANIGKSFEQIIKTIINCKNGKIIISGVGKSGIIGKKWSATLSSTGTPSFFLDASSASHGDMGQITSNDILILISLSGQSEELKNIIQYTSRNKNIKLIGITSKKDSLLYKNAVLKFGKLDFKKFHPSGSLSIKLKTVEDLMLSGKKIPFINENVSMRDALKSINKKNLGTLVIRNNRNYTTGILTDGDLKRINNIKFSFKDLKLKKVMKKRPISVDKDMLAAQALSIMNNKKITSLCVHKNNKKNKTIGFIHIHNILENSSN